MIPAEEFYSGLHRAIPAAGGHILDAEGRALLVKPTYRDHWSWAGGHVDVGETPEAGCARELREELGLTVAVGRLLVVQWVPEYGERPYPLVHFTFDCGVLPEGVSVSLQEDELEGHGFFGGAKAASLLVLPHLVARFAAAETALQTGEIVYLS